MKKAAAITAIAVFAAAGVNVLSSHNCASASSGTDFYKACAAAVTGSQEISSYNSLVSDYDENGVLNAVDLLLMKRSMLYSSESTFSVSSVSELRSALSSVSAGDTILLAPGIYEYSTYGTKGSIFMSSAEGTPTLPITIKSADPANPALLKGVDSASGIVLYITGDCWNIENIITTTAQKGIVLDNSNYSEIKDCEVYNIGSEGIHLRDNSSYCVVNGCNVHDTGVVSPKYGEAVYIGSAYSTTGYGYDCNYNTVKNCTLGPNVAAEHIDIKEYTIGTLVEYCTFDGAGILGQNGGDSYIDIKGNQCVIRRNTGNSNGNAIVVDAFQGHSAVDGWGLDNLVYDNTLTFDSDTQYILRLWSGTSCTVYGNTRTTEGNTYRNFSGSTLTIND